MSVFTTVKKEQLVRYMIMFDMGELVSFEPIEQGIENSNYFVTMEKEGVQTEFVLTLFEELTFDDIPFFNQLSNHLYHYGLPVATARQTLDGMTSTILCGKPTLLFPKLPGEIVREVTPAHCTAIGEALGEIHDTVPSSGLTRAKVRNLNWWHDCQATLQEYLDSEERQLLADVVQTYDGLWPDGDLPAGIIHGDLFRDNVLFQGEKLTGIIDFYHACEDYFILDLAITVNDWCSQPDGTLDAARQRALVAGYQSQREVTEQEVCVWPDMLQVAAALFWMSRALIDAAGDTRKDPQEFKQILRQHRQHPNSFPEAP
jgi:homoserine kinase type II|tara:strand:+ start:11998 stop:12945 length:948 start_codon:yes stop_codon:yes gene_type:complete